MILTINVPAIRTLNELNKANNKTAEAMGRLSSGLRINKSKDDAAGMAISNKMDVQIRGLQQANRNTMDGISLIQTAEGALNETHAILQRMRELSVQAANGSYSPEDLNNVQAEINQLIEEIDKISEYTQFNKKEVLKGSKVDPDEKLEITLQVGANKAQTMLLEIENMSSNKLGVEGLPFNTNADAQAAITTIDKAIELVSEQRGKLGAYQNRLEHTISNLGVSEENLTASMSRIADADMAEEMTNYTQQNIISQAATAMLAQANQRPQQVLQLLQSR
jgi:flagellin